MGPRGRRQVARADRPGRTATSPGTHDQRAEALGSPYHRAELIFAPGRLSMIRMDQAMGPKPSDCRAYGSSCVKGDEVDRLFEQ